MLNNSSIKKGLRIAVVGAGNISQNYHLPSLRRLAENTAALRLCAICDIDEVRAREVASRFNIAKSYTDYRAMLDAEAPDAVWVLVSPNAMYDTVAYLLTKQIPVFMEKPPAETSQATRALAELAQQIPHQVAFNRRYAPLLIKMRDQLIEAGGMAAASCQFYRVRRTEPDFVYGAGLHGLDTLRFLSNSEIRAAYTSSGIGNSRLVTLEFDSGARANVDMLPEVGVQVERYTAHAGDHTIVVDGVIHWLTHYPGFLQHFVNGKETISINSDFAPPEVIGGYYGESAAFVECLLEGRKPWPDLTASIRSIEVAEAVQQGKDIIFSA